MSKKKKDRRSMASLLTVWGEISRSFDQVGMVIPSSRGLAKAMVKPLDTLQAPRRILEVGPGTGPMTKQLLRRMGPQDSLVVCEISARFLDRLRQNLLSDEFYQKNKQRVMFYEGAVQTLHSSSLSSNYDLIVSSLPFLNFTGDEVEELFQLYSDMLSPRGILSTVEYIGIRRCSLVLASPKNRERMKLVDLVIRKWRNKAKREGDLRSEVSLLNFPPALAVQYSYAKGLTSVSRQ